MYGECGMICLNPSASKLLFVVGNPGNLTTDDIEKIALIEGWGYEVALIDDSDSQSEFDTAVGENNVVYVSESVSPNNVSTKLRDVTIGVVNEERALIDEFGFASSCQLPVLIVTLLLFLIIRIT